MSSPIPAIPPVSAVPAPAKVAPKPPGTEPAESTPRPAEHHVSSGLTPADVGYVDSLMGFAPAQVMEYIMLKTGVPMPANLGQDVDTSA